MSHLVNIDLPFFLYLRVVQMLVSYPSNILAMMITGMSICVSITESPSTLEYVELLFYWVQYMKCLSLSTNVLLEYLAKYHFVWVCGCVCVGVWLCYIIYFVHLQKCM